MHLFIQQLLTDTRPECVQSATTKSRQQINYFIRCSAPVCGEGRAARQCGSEPYGSGLRLGSGGGQCRAV